MKIPLKIGALSLTVDSDPILYNILQQIGEVRTLGPDTKDASLDIVVLPSLGISPNLQCFSHGDYDAMPFKPISPSIERFRNRVLDFYLESGIYVIGLGDSAAILWDTLGYKAAVTSKHISLLYDEHCNVEVLGEKDYVINGFRSGNLIGLTNYESKLGSVLLTLRKEIKDELDTSVRMIKEENQPNPTLGGQNKFPEDELNNFQKLDLV